MFLLLLFLLAASAALLYWFAARHSLYWRKRGIQGPVANPLKGNLDDIFWKRPGVLQLQQWTQKFGRVYGVMMGWRPVLITSDPDIVRQMLVDKFEYFHGRNISPLIGDIDRSPLIHLFSAQGKRWKRLRAITTPAFSLTNLKRVMPIIDDSICVTMDLLKEKCHQSTTTTANNVVNLHTYFTEMTFDVISRIAMGQRESRQFHNENCKLAQQCFNNFNNTYYDLVAWSFPWFGHHILHPFLMAAGHLLKEPLECLLRIIMEAVKQRKEQNERKRMKMANGGSEEMAEEEDGKKKRVDFIDLFLEAEEANVQLTKQDKAYDKAEKFERKNTLEEIAMNCFLFLLAGFDTTANSLSVICHNLAMHPDVQEKMCEEIERVCGALDDEDEQPTYEQMSQLKYTEAVVKETLRLCPIGSAVVARVAAETTKLGEYTLEKGTAVQADILTLHKDKQIWGEDADQFRPERWLEEDFVQPQAYYPFGGGPRICIGMRLAMLEEKMTLTHLMRRFRLSRCQQTESELKFTGQVVLNPSSVTVALEPRERQ